MQFLPFSHKILSDSTVKDIIKISFFTYILYINEIQHNNSKLQSHIDVI